MKRMLINATHSEEIRVALADGQKLYNLDIDVPGEDRKKGNIYKGKITRVEPSLEAAFVDYGSKRHGFLPYKEISRNYYTEAANKAKERPPINVAIKEGTEVIIQVNKEERGNKGAAITTYVSLAGRYLVYMPENPKAGGISRRIEGKARQELKTVLDQVKQPKNSGVIVRTAGIGRSVEEIEWDLNYLDQVWTSIKSAAANIKAPRFLYQESAIEIRAIRDYLRPDVGEILIDNKEIYEKTRDFMQQVMPHNLKKLSYYNDTIPLFSRYQIESQIQSAFSREVHLPSGGSLVIDHTEAMIAIDINSARATKGSDIEETALNTNLEAADEIARQMRIRDLGGLVVIDFIDMRNHKNQKAVEQQLSEAVSNDRARVQMSKISKFGLLEMSRQRLKSSINESSQFVCPRCSGHGFIRNIESLSVSILRILEEEAMKPGTGKVVAQVPTKVANFIINDKRDELTSLEKRHSVPMYIVANEHYQSPQFDISRLKKAEAKNFDINTVELNKPESEEAAENKSTQHQPRRQRAAVDVLVPQSQVPERKKESGLKSWLLSLFTAGEDEKSVKSKQQPKKQSKQDYKKSHTNKTSNNKDNTKNQAKKPQHKKPVHTKKGSKPQHKQQKQGQKPPQQKQVQKSRPQVKNNKPTHQKSANQKPNKADEVVSNEEILQRPLGSVASYAAKKAHKNPAPSKPAIKEPAEATVTEPKALVKKVVKTEAVKQDVVIKNDKSADSPKVEAKPKAEVNPKVEAKPKAEVKPKAETKPKAEVQPKVETKPKAEVKPKVEAKPKAEVKPKVEAKPKAEVKPKVETKPKADAKPKKKMPDPTSGIDFDI